MKLVEKLKNKKNLGTIITLVIGMFIGVIIAPICSDSSHDGIESKVQSLELETKDKQKEIETLSAKVEEARPYFDMKKKKN